MLLQDKLKEQPLFFANKDSLWAFNKAHLHPGCYSFVPNAERVSAPPAPNGLVPIDVNNVGNNDYLPNPSFPSIEPMKMASPLVEVFPPTSSDRSKINELRNQLTNRMQHNGNNFVGTMSSTGTVVPSRVQQPMIVNAMPSPTPLGVYKQGSMLMPYLPYPTQLMSFPPEMIHQMQMMAPVYQSLSPADAEAPKQDQFEEIAGILASSKPAMAISHQPPQLTFTKNSVNGYNTRRRDKGSNGNGRESRRSKDNSDKEQNNNNSSQRSNGSSSGSGGNNNNNNNNNHGRENGHNKGVTEVVDDDEDNEILQDELSLEDKSPKKRKRTHAKDPEPSTTEAKVNDIDSDNSEDTVPVKKPRITNIPVQSTPHANVDPSHTSESRATLVARENPNTSTFAVGSALPMPVPRQRSPTPTPAPPLASTRGVSMPQMDNDNATEIDEILGVKIVASRLFFYIRWRIPPGVSEADLECFYSFLPADVANQLAPQKVIQFYQSRIQFDKNVISFGTLPAGK